MSMSTITTTSQSAKLSICGSVISVSLKKTT